MSLFSKRFRFADWPNPEVPNIASGVYAIWNAEVLIYCGMSGQNLTPNPSSTKKQGLSKRLASHASGRLSGDQFCVYVANRLIIPGITPKQVHQFVSGEINLDELTKKYIRAHFDYQFAVTTTRTKAFELEIKCRKGLVFKAKPFLNPA